MSDDALVAVLRAAMTATRTSQADLADLVQRSQAWTSTYLLKHPSKTLRRLFIEDPELFNAIVDRLQLERDSILASIGVPFTATTTPSVPLPRGLPVYLALTPSEIHAQEATEWIYVPGTADPQDLIGLRVPDDTMRPYLNEGDVAIVRPMPGEVRPGLKVAVFVPDHGHVLGVLVKTEADRVLLELLNPRAGDERYQLTPAGSRVVGPIVHRFTAG